MNKKLLNLFDMNVLEMQTKGCAYLSCFYCCIFHPSILVSHFPLWTLLHPKSSEQIL